MAFLSSATIKEQGRTAYYKMLESARCGELIQVRRGVYAGIDPLSGYMIDRNISKLMDYARLLRVANILENQEKLQPYWNNLPS